MLFIGGLTSSGTSIAVKSIKRISPFISTDPYLEGQHTPSHPSFMGRGYKLLSNFSDAQALLVHNWINGFCKGYDDINWFVEKSPCHFSCFLAISRMYNDEPYFIVMKRDPYRCLSSVLARWPNADKDSLYNRLDHMIRFHEEYVPQINNFKYLKYEKLCKKPQIELAKVFSWLNINVTKRKILNVCQKYDISLKHSRGIPKLEKRTVLLCDKLRELWGYK